MKAAVYETFGGQITIQNVAEPTVHPQGAILKVLATGLCLSDWHGWKGHDSDIILPHVPGHELAGEIVEVGREVKKWKRGDRVTLPFVCGCGVCPTCDEGNPQVCPDQFQPGFTHWGSFAEYVSILYADANLVAIPDQIDSVTAASLGCRFATSFRGVVDQGRIRKGEKVAVFGCGGVGLSAIMIAAAMGAEVIAIDIKEEALQRALDVGATSIINSKNSTNVSDHIQELTKGGVHLSLDAIGNPQVVAQSIMSLRRRGRHVQIGLLHPSDANTQLPMDRVIGYELEIFGSHGMAAARYSEMIKMILDGRLSPQLMIDSTLALAEVVATLPTMNEYQGSGIRVIDRF